MVSKRYIPSLEELEAEYEKISLEEFHQRYGKFESLIGDSKACDFVRRVGDKYHKLKKELSYYQERYKDVFLNVQPKGKLGMWIKGVRLNYYLTRLVRIQKKLVL